MASPIRISPAFLGTAFLGAAFLGAAVLAAVLHAADPVAAAQDSAPALTAADCRRLLSGLMSDSADYVPGVSATGEAVAPADLPPSDDATLGGGSHAFDEVEVRLIGRPVPLGDTGIAAELRPGRITVNTRTGEVLLNGQPLTGQDRGALARYCAALQGRDSQR